MNSEVLSDEAAEHYNGERTQESVCKPVLAGGFMTGDHGNQEYACRQIRSRDPEDGQLEMPGPGEIEGQESRQVDSEKAGYFRAVVLCGAAQQRLQEKQDSHHEKKPGARAL